VRGDGQSLNGIKSLEGMMVGLVFGPEKIYFFKILPT
jgi:hypothetical protein